MALLARGWAGARGGEILALLVDHGLRPEAAAECAAAAAALGARGIEARVLRWEGPKPTTGIQAAARDARRCLLEAACREEGILHLLLAHHAADQAETVAIRAARASGPDGRAGMPAVAELQGLRLLRPLLAVPPARLRATLTARGAGWAEDPSNRDPRFRRARLRADPTFPADAWWEDGRTQAEARARRDGELAGHLARAARPHPLGFVRLPAAAAACVPLLARLLVTVAGAAYPPPGTLLRRLAERLGGGWSGRASAAGCLLEARGGELLVAREPGRARDRATLRPGERASWDGRFAIAYLAGPEPLEVAALGEAGRRALPMGLREALRRDGVPPAAAAALPAFFAERTLLACPPLGLWPPPGVVLSAEPRPRAPLAAAPFAGANVVSNAPCVIYPAPTGMPP